MKKLFFIFLFAGQLVFAQSVTREYDYNDALVRAQGFSDVCKLYNGDFLATADIIDTLPFPNDTHRVQLTRMDANANVIWSKTYSPSRFYCRSVCADQRSCYFANWGRGSYSTLVRTDTGVNPLWTRRITNSPAGFSTELNLCTIGPGGGCYVAGYHSSYLPHDDFLWTVRYDTTGNLLWSKSYAIAGEDVYTNSSGMEVNNDGSMVYPFCISHVVDSFGNRFVSCGLIKLDSSGNTIWMHSYSDTASISPFGIKMLPDSGFLISGGLKFGGIYQTFLLRTDKNGVKLWYEYFDSEFYDQRHSITQLSNGNMLLGFTYAITSTWTGGQMIEFDQATGQLISSYRLGGLNLDTTAITTLLPSNGNTIAFGSRTTASPHGLSSHPMTIYFNSPGNSMCNKISNVVTTSYPVLTTNVLSPVVSPGPASFNPSIGQLTDLPYSTYNCLQNGVEDIIIQNDVSIYPNPSADNITIDARHLPGNSCTLYLYDVSGRLLETTAFQNSGVFILQRKGREEGVYFIRLVIDDRTVYNGKILFAD